MTENYLLQVPDSAGTATAMFTGVKSNYYMLGLDSNAKFNECDVERNERSRLDSIMRWAQVEGKHTGVVTTTRVTHATPAALYAHSNNRDWECDSEVPSVYRDCIKDIARQMVEEEPAKYVLFLGYI
jgi:alkaline phosphatase